MSSRGGGGPCRCSGRTPPAPGRETRGRGARADRRERRRVSCLGARCGKDEPGLVGEHDELCAIVRAELPHRPADVGLRRRRADDEPLGDIVVAQAAATSAITSRSRSVSHCSCTGVRARSARAAKSAISRRVMLGASSAPPPATMRIPRNSSSGSASERRLWASGTRRRRLPRCRTPRRQPRCRPRRRAARASPRG